jgi:hypothetical protein
MTATRSRINLPLALAFGLLLFTLVALAPSAAGSAHGVLGAGVANAQEADDEAPAIMPKVKSQVRRADKSLDKAEDFIDDNDYAKAANRLRVARVYMYKARVYAGRLVSTPVDEEGSEGDAEEPPYTPVDTAQAVLDLESRGVLYSTDLFDEVTDATVNTELAKTLSASVNGRDALLKQIYALDPEAEGADFADSLPDLADGINLEIENMTDTLQYDTLRNQAKTALNSALPKVRATLAGLPVGE